MDMPAGTSSRRARANAVITAKVEPVSLMFSVSNPAGQCTRSECGAITAWRVLLSSPSVYGFGMIALKPSFWKS